MERIKVDVRKYFSRIIAMRYSVRNEAQSILTYLDKNGYKDSKAYKDFESLEKRVYVYIQGTYNATIPSFESELFMLNIGILEKETGKGKMINGKMSEWAFKNHEEEKKRILEEMVKVYNEYLLNTSFDAELEDLKSKYTPFLKSIK
jgi:tRNA(Phe) wybutosine-synthesizing methylase Tyw3